MFINFNKYRELSDDLVKKIAKGEVSPITYLPINDNYCVEEIKRSTFNFSKRERDDCDVQVEYLGRGDENINN